jgi:hypothetical protein
VKCVKIVCYDTATRKRRTALYSTAFSTVRSEGAAKAPSVVDMMQGTYYEHHVSVRADGIVAVTTKVEKHHETMQQR